MPSAKLPACVQEAEGGLVHAGSNDRLSQSEPNPCPASSPGSLYLLLLGFSSPTQPPSGLSQLPAPLPDRPFGSPLRGVHAFSLLHTPEGRLPSARTPGGGQPASAQLTFSQPLTGLAAASLAALSARSILSPLPHSLSMALRTGAVTVHVPQSAQHLVQSLSCRCTG